MLLQLFGYIFIGLINHWGLISMGIKAEQHGFRK